MIVYPHSSHRQSIKSSLFLAALAFLCALFLLSGTALANDDSESVGFVWHEFEDVGVRLKGPMDWNHRAEVHDKVRAHFVSREIIRGDSDFKTGVTLNVFAFGKNPPGAALNSGKSFMGGIVQRFAEEPNCGIAESGPLLRLRCQGRLSGPGNGFTSIQYDVIANTATEKLYVFIFETPEGETGVPWSQLAEIADSVDINENY